MCIVLNIKTPDVPCASPALGSPAFDPPRMPGKSAKGEKQRMTDSRRSLDELVAVAQFSPGPDMAALERLYDGPIPEPARATARIGGAGAQLASARGQMDCFNSLIRSQLEALRRSKRIQDRDGPGMRAYLIRLHDDLQLYRRQHRFWRRTVWRLAKGPAPYHRATRSA
jgi:hypothetical protein